jgi:hypothetical protein
MRGMHGEAYSGGDVLRVKNRRAQAIGPARAAVGWPERYHGKFLLV